MTRITLLLVISFFITACSSGSSNTYQPSSRQTAVNYHYNNDPYFSSPSYFDYNYYINRYSYRYPNYYSTRYNKRYKRHHKRSFSSNKHHRIKHRNNNKVKRHSVGIKKNRNKNNRISKKQTLLKSDTSSIHSYRKFRRNKYSSRHHKNINKPRHRYKKRFLNNNRYKKERKRWLKRKL